MDSRPTVETAPPSWTPRLRPRYGGLLIAAIIAGCAATRRDERSILIQHATTDPEFHLFQARLSQAYQDMTDGNLDRLMQLYAPDAIIQSPKAVPVAGTAAIRAFWFGTFGRY